MRYLPVLMQRHDVLCLGVIPVDIVCIAGCHQGDTQTLGHVDRSFHGETLDFNAVVHDFNEISVTKQVLEPLSHFHRLLQVGFTAAAS